MNLSYALRLGLRNRHGEARHKNRPFDAPQQFLLHRPHPYSENRRAFSRRARADCLHAAFQSCEGGPERKANVRTDRHAFLFRRLVRCVHCGFATIGESQKGHAYYRCHTKNCPVTCTREEAITECVPDVLSASVVLGREILPCSEGRGDASKLEWGARTADPNVTAQNRAEPRAAGTPHRCLSGYLDGTIDKALFEERKTAFLMERKNLEGTLIDTEAGVRSMPDRFAEYLELAERAYVERDHR